MSISNSSNPAHSCLTVNEKGHSVTSNKINRAHFTEDHALVIANHFANYYIVTLYGIMYHESKMGIPHLF